MWQDEGAGEFLSEDECWALLQEQSLGRIEICAVGELDIVPINFVADGRALLLRTAPGTKLVELAVDGHVALETDGYTERKAWSVVVKEQARLLEHQSEIDAADKRPLRPWIPTLKYRYVETHRHS